MRAANVTAGLMWDPKIGNKNQSFEKWFHFVKLKIDCTPDIAPTTWMMNIMVKPNTSPPTKYGCWFSVHCINPMHANSRRRAVPKNSPSTLQIVSSVSCLMPGEFDFKLIFEHLTVSHIKSKRTTLTIKYEMPFLGGNNDDFSLIFFAARHWKYVPYNFIWKFENIR